MENQEHQEMILKGIGGSPGICIGKAYLVDKEGVDVVKKYVSRRITVCRSGPIQNSGQKSPGSAASNHR
jgi:hypothetical protein